jgi:hypothetical protein
MCTLDFIKKAFGEGQGGDLVAATAICSVVTKMGDPLYLFFDENRTAMLGFFCLGVVSSLRDSESVANTDLLKTTSSRLRERENEGDGQQAATIRNILLVINTEYL